MTTDHYRPTLQPRQSDDYRRSLEMDRSRIRASLTQAKHRFHRDILLKALVFVEGLLGR